MLLLVAIVSVACCRSDRRCYAFAAVVVVAAVAAVAVVAVVAVAVVVGEQQQIVVVATVIAREIKPINLHRYVCHQYNSCCSC